MKTLKVWCLPTCQTVTRQAKKKIILTPHGTAEGNSKSSQCLTAHGAFWSIQVYVHILIAAGTQVNSQVLFFPLSFSAV